MSDYTTIDALVVAAGSGKLNDVLVKLIELTRDGIGAVYEPTAIRRRADAERDAAITRASADASVLEINTKSEGKDLALRQRIRARLERTETRRQQSREAIVLGAARIAGALPAGSTAATPEPVGQDWIDHFFASCEDVSNAEMQALWSRLLAGEVTRPGTYSLLTLNTVRTMSKSDADLFTHAAAFACVVGRAGPFFLRPTGVAGYIDQQKLPYDAWLHLSALGLVQVSPMTTTLPVGSRVTYFDEHYELVEQDPAAGPLRVHEHGTPLCASFALTRVGRELLPIAGGRKDDGFSTVLLAGLLVDGIPAVRA